ncbi:hypothetical protein OCD65_28025 [Bacillus paranthracis]|uniref:hypothetical protein n=1 Tax=Bacillus cereus group TaxID=86661 RepID=UPI001F591F1B|nr:MULTISPECIES: hypothetical protein [Bacillus cereus group]MCU5020530.1 hypothetical protein [Bacillus paranthracis]
MTKYTEEQFIYFKERVERLSVIQKEDREAYIKEYKHIQDWLQEQGLSTEFISWFEKKTSL